MKNTVTMDPAEVRGAAALDQQLAADTCPRTLDWWAASELAGECRACHAPAGLHKPRA